jgi:hypothetical protein
MKVAFSSCRAKVDFGLNLRVREGRSAPDRDARSTDCEGQELGAILSLMNYASLYPKATWEPNQQKVRIDRMAELPTCAPVLSSRGVGGQPWHYPTATSSSCRARKGDRSGAPTGIATRSGNSEELRHEQEAREADAVVRLYGAATKPEHPDAEVCGRSRRVPLGPE